MKTLQAAPPAFIERCGGLLSAMLYTHFINSCRKGDSAIMLDDLVEMTGEKKSTILIALEEMSEGGLLKGYTANETGFVIQDLVITVGGPAQPNLFDDKSNAVSREKRLYDDVAVGDVIYRGQVEEIKQGDATLYYRLKITARDSGTSIDDATLKMDMSDKFGNAKLAFAYFDEYVEAVEKDGPQPSPEVAPESPVVDTEPAKVEGPLEQIRRLIEANFIPKAESGRTKVQLAPVSYKAALKANRGRAGDPNGVFSLVESTAEGIELDGFPEPVTNKEVEG